MYHFISFLQDILGFFPNLGCFCLSQEMYLFHPFFHCRFWAPRKSGTRLSSEVTRATFLRTSLISMFPRKCDRNGVTTMAHFHRMHARRTGQGKCWDNILHFGTGRDCHNAAHASASTAYFYPKASSALSELNGSRWSLSVPSDSFVSAAQRDAGIGRNCI